MIGPSKPAYDPLHGLVVRIAAGDQAAFRDLYAFLASQVWRDAVRVMPQPADARAVTRSTFVEVWHLAGHHVEQSTVDTRSWIAGIFAHHLDDRLRGAARPGGLSADFDSHKRHEFSALLGTGPGPVSGSG